MNEPFAFHLTNRANWFKNWFKEEMEKIAKDKFKLGIEIINPFLNLNEFYGEI